MSLKSRRSEKMVRPLKADLKAQIPSKWCPGIMNVQATQSK